MKLRLRYKLALLHVVSICRYVCTIAIIFATNVYICTTFARHLQSAVVQLPIDRGCGRYWEEYSKLLNFKFLLITVFYVQCTIPREEESDEGAEESNEKAEHTDVEAADTDEDAHTSGSEEGANINGRNLKTGNKNYLYGV